MAEDRARGVSRILPRLILFDVQRQFFLELFSVLALAFAGVQLIGSRASARTWRAIKLGEVTITPFTQAMIIIATIWGVIALVLVF